MSWSSRILWEHWYCPGNSVPGSLFIPAPRQLQLESGEVGRKDVTSFWLKRYKQKFKRWGFWKPTVFLEIGGYIQIQTHVLPSLSLDLKHGYNVWHQSYCLAVLRTKERNIEWPMSLEEGTLVADLNLFENNFQALQQKWTN